MLKFIKVGRVTRAKVTGVSEYGIFVNVSNLYTGLIHISEVTNSYVKDIREYAKVGDIIYCEIKEIDEDNKKLKLSIKDVNYRYYLNNDELKETKLGFLPLRNMLDTWVEDRLVYYKYYDE